MAWLTTKEFAALEGISERTVRRNIAKYDHRPVNGRGGNRGESYEISSDSLTDPEQYVTQQASAEDALYQSLDADQRRAVDERLTFITEYGDFKRTYHKKDKLQTFLAQYNSAHPDRPLNKRVLNHWEKKYRDQGLAGLVDRRGGHNKGTTSIPLDVWDIFRYYMSQPGNPSMMSCYINTKAIFPEIEYFPHFSSFQRRWEKEHKAFKILINEGQKAFEDKCLPYNIIDRTSICSNEWWIADHHIFDVLCVDEKGKVFRPWGCFWQDWRSSKITGFLLSKDAPNSDLILDSFARGCHSHGIPDNVKLDNGKDFKVYDLFNSKFPLSLSEKLGIHVSRALPYNAKAKPIERFFGTLEGFDKHLDAYVGNAPHKRPEHMKAVNAKMKDKAMPYDRFLDFIKNAVTVYNDTPHSGEGMDNQSPNEAYAANFVRPMRVVEDSSVLNLYLQRTSRPLTVGRNGIRLPQTKFYYDDKKLFAHFGKKVFARFDIDNVKQVYVYSERDEFICIAKSKDLCTLDIDVSMETIRSNEKLKAQRRKAVKEMIPQVNVPTIEEIVASRASQGKVINFQEMKETVPMVDSTKKKHVQAIRAEEQRQADSELDGGTMTALGVTEEELDEILFQAYQQAEGGL